MTMSNNLTSHEILQVFRCTTPNLQEQRTNGTLVYSDMYGMQEANVTQPTFRSTAPHLRDRTTHQSSNINDYSMAEVNGRELSLNSTSGSSSFNNSEATYIPSESEIEMRGALISIEILSPFIHSLTHHCLFKGLAHTSYIGSGADRKPKGTVLKSFPKSEDEWNKKLQHSLLVKENPDRYSEKEKKAAINWFNNQPRCIQMTSDMEKKWIEAGQYRGTTIQAMLAHWKKDKHCDVCQKLKVYMRRYRMKWTDNEKELLIDAGVLESIQSQGNLLDPKREQELNSNQF